MSGLLRTALNNLRRGGQRAWVALLCVTFGVMSLVAMTLLSQAIQRTLVIDPSHQLAAAVSAGRRQEDVILPEHTARLDTLQEAGVIRRYTLVSQISNLIFFTEGSGEVRFTSDGMGVDPQVYPLAGSLVLAEPKNVGVATLLQALGDVLVTRDLALEYNLQVGDTIRLSDMTVGAPVESRIRGILQDTPNHKGSKIYYTVETAEALAGGLPALNVALIDTADDRAVAEALEADGWNVYTASQHARNEKEMAELFDLTLKGAGILGLMVGGIGIANTMQVLLRRRRGEVAVWKTLGYRERDLQVLFAIEAALLGVTGSVAGAGLGLLISQVLVELFRRTGNMLLVWQPSIPVLVTSAAVGTLTTVIFAMWAIVVTSRVEPLALLRNETVSAARLPWFQGAALALILGLPFLGLTSLVLGSLWKGLGVILFALAGLLVLGGMMAVLVWGGARLLPFRGLPLVRMAQNSLRRRGLGLVFAMIALFVGVVSLSLGVMTTDAADREMDERTILVEDYNLALIAPAAQEAAVRQTLAEQEAELLNLGAHTSVRSVRLVGVEGNAYVQPLLIGRSELVDVEVSGAEWGSRPDGVYLFSINGKKPAQQVEVTLWDGSTHILDVVGTYQPDWSPAHLNIQTGVLLPLELNQRLAPPDSMLFYARVPEGREAAASQSLGAALPEATVMNMLDFSDRYTATYHSLFLLALAMSALALLAGILLVANSVSLAMLDRRYEIGVFKAVGYSRRHVLTSLVIEYGLMALIATAAGLVAVQVFLWVLALVNNLAGSLLILSVPSMAVIGLSSVGLVLLTVLGVTWRPTQVSPIVILNERGA